MTTASGARLVGRRGALDALGSYLDEATKGLGRVVVVSGEAGMGKTRLCEELASGAHSRGAGLAWTACSETGELPPLWPLRQLLAQLGETWPGVPDEAVLDGPVVARAEWFDRIVGSLRSAAAARPRLLVIDDVQWADLASLRMLAFLAPLLRTIPALLLAARRDEPVGPAHQLLLRELDRHARLVPLVGLGEDEAAAVVAEVVGRRPGPEAVKALHRGTGGNPLFVREIAGLLDRAGGLDSLAGDDVLPVTSTISAIQAGRLGAVGDSARRLLAVAALVGEEWSTGVAATVSGLGGAEAAAMVDDAVAAGLVRASGPDRYSFAHPLIRSCLQQGLGASQRAVLHRAVAVELDRARSRGGAVDPAAVAYHYLGAGPSSAAEAVAACLEASAAARGMLAYDEAVLVLERALELVAVRSGGDDRGELLLALGDARAAAGDPGGAREALMAAATEARAAGRHDLLARAALGLSPAGGFEVSLFDQEQVGLLEAALQGLEADDPAHEGLRAWCQARLSVALTFGGQDQRRQDLSDAAVASARRAADPSALVHALAARCDCRAGPAHVEARLGDASEMVALARTRAPVPDRSGELLGRRLRVVALLESGDLAGADAEVNRFARVAGDLRHPVHQWYVPMWRGMRALMEGRLGDFERLVAEAGELGQRAQSANAGILVLGLRWFALVEQGDEPGAAELFESLLGGQPVAELGVQMVPVIARHYLMTARVAEARALLDANFEAFVGAPVDSEWLPTLAQLAEVLALLGGHEIAPWLYEALAPNARRWVVEGIGAYARGPVSGWLGILAALTGRPEAAAGHFDDSVRRLRAGGARLLAARALHDWGTAVGDVDRLREARGEYIDLGLDLRAAQLGAELSGLSPRPGAVEVTVPTPPADLLTLEGDVWALSYAGRVARVRDSKGMHDLARLVAEAGREVAAVDLMGTQGPGGRPVGSDLGPVLDPQARDAYRRRLKEIEVQLDEADSRADAGASAALQEEKAALVAQLSAAFGLGGRPRRPGDPAERARTAVTARIRDAIRRVTDAHPQLGRHLARSVRTGAFCSYDP